MKSIDEVQKDLCHKFGASFFEAAPHLKVGIAKNTFTGVKPIRGLRHLPIGDTSGWYIWAGEEPSQDRDFFQPMHICHLEQSLPVVLKYLGLPPGWRFLTDGNCDDVWQDDSLLHI